MASPRPSTSECNSVGEEVDARTNDRRETAMTLKSYSNIVINRSSVSSGE
jgi:hypothetical protein